MAVVAGFQGLTPRVLCTTRSRRLGHDCRCHSRGLERRPLRDIHGRRGIYTTDPNICNEAREKLKKVSYDEMLGDGEPGAKVLQTRSVEFAKNTTSRSW